MIEIPNFNEKDILEAIRVANIRKVVVGAVIFKDNHVLMLKRQPDEFLAGLVELPSGKVEKGESLISALIREVKEETNLKVVSISQYLGYFDYKSGSGKNTRQLNFIVNTTGSPSINLSEHDTFYWFDKTNSFENVSEKTKSIVQLAFKEQVR